MKLANCAARSSAECICQMTAISDSVSAHFVPLSVIMADHGGDLGAYMAAHGTRDVTVTMAVEMEVAGRGGQKFYVAVAVTWNFGSAEPLEDAAIADCPAGHQLVFAWVPAHSYGTDDFGVYFEDAGIGATLQNGLIAEIIEKAQVEALMAGG